MEKQDKKYMFFGVIFSLLIVFLIGYFLKINYTDDYLLLAIMSIITFSVLIYGFRKGFFEFFLVAASSISLFISVEVSFNLHYMANYFLCILIGLSLVKYYSVNKEDKTYLILILSVFLVDWVILAFNVVDRKDWILENLINVPFVLVLVYLAKKFRFSKLSYVLIFFFMFMNVVGSHYTYSMVPLGEWAKDYFGWDRNHYDRLVHFSFGLLFAYPMREIFVRLGGARGFWALWMPIEFVLGLSAVYEILEWWIAILFGGDLGIAYLGTQGDIWDAQKDMFLAGFGSFITMGITFFALLIFKKNYLKEIFGSFKSKREGLPGN